MNNEINSLVKELQQVKVVNENKKWDDLPQRKLEELEFHDRDRDETVREQVANTKDYETYYGNKKFYSTTEKSVKYLENWLHNNVKGKIFLDYACGNGETAIKAAQKGASYVIGLDISSVSVNNATAAAQKAGVGDRCIFIQGDCEDTGLPENCFDIVMCNGMLHHLDLSYAFPELRRILKPKGKVFAYEALDYNPLIKLYRMMTPAMRTDWEKKHILSLRDINFAKYFFEIEEVKYWHITSYLAAFFKKIPFLMNIFLTLFNFLDEILSRIPFVKQMAWIFTFVLVKKEKEI